MPDSKAVVPAVLGFLASASIPELYESLRRLCSSKCVCHDHRPALAVLLIEFFP